MIAYVEHPVSQEEKKDIMSKGFKIVDIKFMPKKIGKDDEVLAKSKSKKDEK